MIVSILALLSIAISIFIKDRKKSLIVQSLSCLFEAIYGFLINALTGACVSIFNFLRSIIFINKNKFSRIFYIFILIYFEVMIMLNCYLTWVGIISLLPTVASMLRAYCLWQSNMKLVRISCIFSGTLFGIYYLFYDSIFMAIGNFILALVGVCSVVKNDILLKK